jgi:hypothetical protein
MASSANLMLRELGITLFLTCVGLNAGIRFVDVLVNGDGLHYMALASLITFIPIFVVGIIGHYMFKVNYLSLCGTIAGSMTDPPALAFANAIAPSDATNVAYAAVYPLTCLCAFSLHKYLHFPIRNNVTDILGLFSKPPFKGFSFFPFSQIFRIFRSLNCIFCSMAQFLLFTANCALRRF